MGPAGTACVFDGLVRHVLHESAQPSTSTSRPVRVSWATRSAENLQQGGDDACGQLSADSPARDIARGSQAQGEGSRELCAGVVGHT